MASPSARGTALAPAANARPASPGVAAGEITATSALLWTRSNDRPVRSRLADPRRGMPVVQVDAAGDRSARPASSSGACTVCSRIVATSISFSVAVPAQPPRQPWVLPDRAGAVATRRRSGSRSPATPTARTIRRRESRRYNLFQVYGRMAAERNHFNINLGDTIYSDSEVGGVPPALTIAAKWAKYKQNLGFGHLRNLRRGDRPLQPLGRPRVHQRLLAGRARCGGLPARGVIAFTRLRARDVPAANGLYRTFRWGKHLELFFLDERSFRSAKVRAVCANDLAPTAPQAVRNAFAALVPALANPVPQACLDAIDDPSRTMLGARQYAAFTRRSTRRPRPGR